MSAEAPQLSYEPLIDPEHPVASMEQIRRLVFTLPARELAGIRGGDNVTRRSGHGLEKDGIRDYEIGDDPQHIDWKKTAVHPDEKLQLRERFREITPKVWIVSDAPQERNDYDIKWGFSQQELANSAVMAAGYMFSRQGLPVAYLGINDHDIRQSSLRPSRNSTNMLAIGRTMIDLSRDRIDEPTSEPRNLSDGIKRVARLATRNIVVVVSDFRAEKPESGKSELEASIAKLAHKKNEIIALEINSPWHRELPKGREDESGGKGRAIWTGGKKAPRIREAYAAIEDRNQAQIDRMMQKYGSRHIRLSTEDGMWFTGMRRELRKSGRR